MITINRIHHGDCHDLLSFVEPGTVDLTVFSPPYDDLRGYGGGQYDLPRLGDQLYRVTKVGGVVAMVIADQTKNHRKSMTTFRTIVDWVDRVGWNLWECLILHRHGKPGPYWNYRFRTDHEYIPVFFKGNKPRVFHKGELTVPCRYSGRHSNPVKSRQPDGTYEVGKTFDIPEEKCIGSVWRIDNFPNQRDTLSIQHPATFAEQVPSRLIRALTNEGDLVLDPMAGSGTTAVAALQLGKRFIGMEIHDKYCKIARRRVADTTPSLPGYSPQGRTKWDLTPHTTVSTGHTAVSTSGAGG